MIGPVRTMLAAAVALLAVAGCGTSIPDSSDVRRARAAANAQEPPPNSYIPRDPVRGAPPREIVDGFLDAMNAYPRSIDLARKFLTPSAAAAWNPSGAVSVYRSRHTSTPVNGMVTMVATHLGSLDDRGTWTTHESRYEKSYLLIQVKGQWRISDPPKILLVDSEYFGRYYAAASLYFFASSRTSLVPDPVYVLKGSGMASDLVRALMDGPPARLRGVVSTALGAVGGASVRIRGGVATVSLPSAARTWSPGNPELIAVQLVWTLRQVQEITGVRIRAGGGALAIAGAQSVIDVADAYAAFGPVGLNASQGLKGVADGRIVSVGTAGDGRVAGRMVSLTHVQSIAVAVADDQVAAVTNRGRSLVVGGATRDSSDIGTWVRGRALRSPTWDRAGYVWVVDDAAGKSRIIAATNTGVRTIAAPGLTGQDVQELRVSRDGARLAALVGRAGDARIVVAEVVRDGHAVPLRIQDVEPIQHSGDPLRSPASFDWYTPTSLLVLSTGGEGKQTPFIVSIDGATVEPSVAFTSLPAISQLAAGSDVSVPIGALGVNGSVYALGTDDRWEKQATTGDVTEIRYPG